MPGVAIPTSDRSIASLDERLGALIMLPLDRKAERLITAIICFFFFVCFKERSSLLNILFADF